MSRAARSAVSGVNGGAPAAAGMFRSDIWARWKFCAAVALPSLVEVKFVTGWQVAPTHSWMLSTCKRPLYLTGMAVRPDFQRRGLGRRCVDEAIRIARDWPADAIRLDAYDADAGAGLFYHKCGFTETGRKTYRSVPLTYYELGL